MSRNVNVSDGRFNKAETVPLVVPAGAGYTTQDSLINAMKDGNGLATEGLDEIVVSVAITDTMPADSEIVITPYVIGFPALDDITILFPTATNASVQVRLDHNDALRDADFIKITYRFKQGTEYTVTALTLQIKKKPSVAESISIEKIGQSTFDDVQDAINQIGSAGSGSDSYITDAGGGSINVAAGAGFIRVTDSHNSTLKAFDWPARAGIAIPADVARYVGIEYNAGAPQIKVKTSDSWDWHTEFRLGSVVNEGGTLHILNNPQRLSDAIAHIFERFYECRPLERAARLGGIIAGETGTRNLTVSAGELYDGLNEFDVGAIDTSGADTFDAYYRGSPFTKVAVQTQWDNLQYDTGAGLGPLGVAKYGLHWLYLEADNNLVTMYGEGNYNTIAAAENADPPSSIPLRLQVHGVLIGRIIFQQNAATAIAFQSVWDTQFDPTLVSSHNSLSNVTPDQHHNEDHAERHKGGGADEVDGATTTVAGLMSGADKLRLDSLAGGNVTTPIRNETGGVLSKHKLIAVIGYSGTHSRPLVNYADKDNAALRPCIAILTADLNDNSNADALVVGTLTGVDTSSWALTDQLVLGVSGAISRPPPDEDPFTGEVQNIGSVSVVNASTGQIVIAIDGQNPVTAGQIFAAAGTNGTPSKANPYVTDSDPRNTDDRDPTAHGTADHSGTIGAASQVDNDSSVPGTNVDDALQSLDASISAVSSGYSRRTAVINVVDCTAAPPTEVLDDRYILDFTGGTVNAAWDGAAKGDIVDFNGSTWDALTPAEGWVCYVDALNKDALYVDDGAPAWELRPAYTQLHTDLTDVSKNQHHNEDHAGRHDAGGADAMAIDAAAGTGSLRTLGAGAAQACAGDDSRLTDDRDPTDHAGEHEPGGGDTMAVDAAAGTGSLRTLGAGAAQACAGNDSRLDVGSHFLGTKTKAEMEALVSPTLGDWVISSTYEGKHFYFDGVMWVLPGEVVRVTNQTGGTRVEGDVVILHQTIPRACDGTTTVESFDVLGAIVTGGDDGEPVTVAVAGLPWNVNVEDSAQEGHFVATDNTAFLANADGVPSKGAFGSCLEDKGSGTGLVSCWLHSKEVFEYIP